MSNKRKFLGYTISGMIFGYPFFFLSLLVTCPTLFTLPARNFSWSHQMRSGWRGSSLPASQSRRQRRKCWGVCCGLSTAYYGIVVVGIWGTIHLGDSELRKSVEAFSKEAWAGNYVSIEKTRNSSSVTFYSPSRVILGDVKFTENPRGWIMSINGSTGIDEIVYSRNTNDTLAIELAIFCRAERDSISNNTSSCITGQLNNDPVKHTKGQDIHPGEFKGDFNLTLSVSNRTDILNTSAPTVNLRASPSDYQGIGQKFAPLGRWYLNSSIILHVAWSSGANRACDGLTINLAKKFDAVGWTLVGLIWEWWKSWSQGGGCPQGSENQII